MGRLVASSPAVPAGVRWAALDADRKLINSGMLLFGVVMVSAYALAGVLYGVLPFVVGEGIVEFEGIPLLFVALGCLALAGAGATHLVQRHWSTASRAWCEHLRTLCHCAWGGTWLAAFAAALVPGWPALHRRLALAPEAEWLLAPVPWVWSFFVHLASDAIAPRLMLFALVAMGLAYLAGRKLGLPRVSLFLGGLGFSAGSAIALGGACHHYASVRGVSGPLASPERIAAFVDDPGAHNAWTFCLWWAGSGAFLFGAMMLAFALTAKPQALRKFQRDFDQA